MKIILEAVCVLMWVWPHGATAGEAPKPAPEITAAGLAANLKSEDMEVRRTAAEELGWLATADAIPFLEKAARDAVEDVCWQAAWSLGAIGTPEAAAALARLVDDPAYPHRKTASYELGSTATPAQKETLLRMLPSPEPDLRRDAAIGLDRIGARDALPGLVKLLSDEDFVVRRYAVRAVFALGGPGELEAVKARYPVEDDPEAKVYLAGAMARFGDRSTLETLRGFLKADEFYVREGAAVVLGAIGDPKAIPWLEEAVKDETTDVAAAAVVALSLLKAEGATALFFRMIEDPGNDVLRLSVASRFPDAGLEGAVPRLVKAMEDPDGFTRVPVYKALRKVGAGNPEVIRAFVQKLTPGNPSGDLDHVLPALAVLGDGSALPALAAVAAGPDRKHAIMAAGAIQRIRERSPRP
ncbi:MAG: HEAT repeat domain-containing protein [Deltaproteobacteria bacterium]|nr:HEAT repeat domain-containing protein [Deltaproteobacteria bacterium]